MYDIKGRSNTHQYKVEDYLGLVSKIAAQIKAKLPGHIEEEDLFQAGTIGLIDAINRYEEYQSAQFETYATLRIRGAIFDELRHLDWIPRAIRENMRKIEDAIFSLQTRLQRHPTETEIAQALELNIEAYHKFLNENAGHQLLYLEDFDLANEGEQFLERYDTGQDQTPLKNLVDLGFQTALTEAIEELPEKEKLVMGLYYEQDLNLREIGAVLDITQSRVSQIHSQAISRLRTRMKEHKWIGEA